jgi:serine protease Do
MALALVGAGAVTAAARDGGQRVVSAAPAEDPSAVEVRVEPGRRIAVLGGRGVQLGVTIRDLDPGEQPSVTGAVVERVREGSAAEKAGLRAGDVITEFDGERVRGARHLARLVSETPEGRTVAMSVRRDGSTVSLSATPGIPDMAHQFEELVDPQRFELPPDLDSRLELRQRELERMLPGAIEPEAFRGFGDRFRYLIRPGGRRLGVQYQELTPQLAAYFKVDDGVLISAVEEDSPAARAGLAAGDVVTRVNGEAIASGRDLVEALRTAEGESVTIDYVRGGAAATLTVTLEKPKPARRSARPI